MNHANSLVRGVIGGAVGIGCMTALRMAARRAGWIDLTPPQATKHWLAARIGAEPGSAGGHHVADTLIHLAVGVSAGAAYGVIVEKQRRTSLISGALFGLGVWAMAFGLVMPRLGVTPAPWRGSWMETAANVAAHIVYGAATALVTGELAQQAHGPTDHLRGLRGRVG